ncbi:conserved hypothetical protein [Leishmania major strain Friedlin]|uniref:Uncharacterized protein n=1 Tax=Leishmania major TaxID=5664 RepID=Q4QEY0_LEIMA|nr:conserved hypothetical protein [Leishmania major strain Friedlin]CAG9572074.1 hypothetical_protein_-_conserved [Leishmania major strain Friedlin]CAJ03507.1 conserved hypothetical protein [Leishmania major strain Friedlin]|eukprot:XP_001682118.1 conserved hypothetical protein [Leishmania major strain Friedlin]
MAPERCFPHGFLRRLQRATFLFFSMLAALYATTSLYYVVRISVVEEPDLYHQIGSNVKGFAQRWVPWAVPMSEHLAGSPSAAEADAASLLVTLRASSHEPYTQMYKALRIGEPLTRQRVRNPALPADVPLSDDDRERPSAEHGGSLRNAVPLRQRYVLDKLQAGRRYMIRLSFLGSPSVGFDLVLYQVRRSSVQRFLKDSIDAAGAASPTARGWSEEPQDTELFVFSTSRDNALEFRAEKDVWVDREDIDGVASGSDGTGATLRGVIRAASGTDDPFVPVVEVRPRALSIPVDAYRVPIVLFNIELEWLSWPFLPKIVVLFLIYFVWVLVFVGYLGVYTLVSSGIAGGEEVKQNLD